MENKNIDPKEFRIKVLQLHYDKSNTDQNSLVLRPEIAKELNCDYNDSVLLKTIKFLEDKDFLKSATNVQDSITTEGIEEVEAGFPILKPKINAIELFRTRLKQLHQETSVVIGQAMNVENDLKISLKKTGLTDAEFLNSLRYLIGKKYLKGYSHPEDLDTVSLTDKGYDWIMEIESPEDAQELNFDYFSCFKKMSKKIQELLEEINGLPKTKIDKYSSMIAHQLRTLLRLILIQWWEDINEKTIPKNKRAGLEDLIQYSINNSLTNKLNGAKTVVKQLEEIKKYKTMTDNTIHDEGTTVDSDDCAKYRANLKNIISSIYR